MGFAGRFLGQISRAVARCVRDEGGNVAIVFGVSMIPLLIAVGVAVDFTQGSAVKQKLAGTADSIALAAARSYRDLGQRDKIGEKFLNGNLADYGGGVQVTGLSVKFDDTAEVVTVALKADIPTRLLSIAGISKQSITSEAKVSYGGQVSEPVSLSMVLDVSGSMNRSGRIGTLRTAADHLLGKLEAADPNDFYVRTGLVTYSNRIRQTVGMDWGFDHTGPVIRGLTANGGTASTDAVAAAGGWLQGTVEQAEHEGQPVHNGAEFKLNRFLIFMTDGNNNRRSDDTATQSHCDRLKGDGIEIFAVAFAAPSRGRKLLSYCATSDEHYFDASNSTEFLAAFEEIGNRIESSILRIVQ